MEEDLERYESEVELKIYKEYHDVLPMFRYVVETERRFYLANEVNLEVREANGSVFFEVEMKDAWVWDMFRPARFLEHVKVLTFRDVSERVRLDSLLGQPITEGNDWAQRINTVPNAPQFTQGPDGPQMSGVEETLDPAFIVRLWTVSKQE